MDDEAEVDLTIHMLQHVLIILAGVMVAYPLLGRRIVRDGWKGQLPGLGLAAAAAILVFWHLPLPWDSAVLNPAIHVTEHLSFFFVGLLSGSLLLGLGESGKLAGLLAAFFGHMVYAVALISPWNIQFYSLYSLGNQQVLGWVLILTGPSLLVGAAYVVWASPTWLSALGGVELPVRKRTLKITVPNRSAAAISIVLAVILIGYYASVAVALNSVNHPAGAQVVVDIEETPISWQYSPQNITVVVGVNSTVVWLSHSLSYDTVTESHGAFSSGPIAPGQQFAFQFTEPGVYQYYCQYHPWMRGSVTVLA